MVDFQLFCEDNAILEMDPDQRQQFKAMHGYDPVTKGKTIGVSDIQSATIDNQEEPEFAPDIDTPLFTYDIPTGYYYLADGAFWLSPYGKMIFLPPGFRTKSGGAPHTTRHIDLIIKNPEVFGITKEYVVSVFEQENEPNPYSGEAPKAGESGARGVIIRALLLRGWVRIRNYSMHERWTINLGIVNKKLMLNIEVWAQLMMDKNGHHCGKCYLDYPSGTGVYTMSEMADGKASENIFGYGK